MCADTRDENYGKKKPNPVSNDERVHFVEEHRIFDRQIGHNQDHRNPNSSRLASERAMRQGYAQLCWIHSLFPVFIVQEFTHWSDLNEFY